MKQNKKHFRMPWSHKKTKHYAFWLGVTYEAMICNAFEIHLSFTSFVFKDNLYTDICSACCISIFKLLKFNTKNKIRLVTKQKTILEHITQKNKSVHSIDVNQYSIH